MGQFLPSLLVFACAGIVLIGVLWATRRYRWMQSHWIGFAFLLPFLVMLWTHRVLHLSNALMVSTPPGERESHIFNWVMVTIFCAGIAGFIAHTLSLAGRGPRWAAAKLLVLVVYWGGILHYGA